MRIAHTEFLRALRHGDSIRVRFYADGRRSFIVCDRAGDPVDMHTRGWRRRRRQVSMIDALARAGLLTTRYTRPRDGELRYVLSDAGRLERDRALTDYDRRRGIMA